MLGDDGALGAGDLRAAQDRAQVLRIHDRVERDQQRRIRLQQLTQRPIAPRFELCGDALVHPRCHRIQFFRRHDFDPRELGQLIQARIVADPRCQIDLDHPPGSHGLQDCVPSVNQLSQTILNAWLQTSWVGQGSCLRAASTTRA